MLDKLILGRYLQGDSWIHKLDPRTKLIGTFAFVLVIFLANNWVTYGLLIAYTLIALLLSKIPLGFFWKGIKPLIWVILFTVALQILFTSGGDVYFQWGFIQVTSEGIINAVFIFLRFVLIISFSTLLTLTTAPLQLTRNHIIRRTHENKENTNQLFPLPAALCFLFAYSQFLYKG